MTIKELKDQIPLANAIQVFWSAEWNHNRKLNACIIPGAHSGEKCTHARITQSNRYKCYACGFEGDIFDLFETIDGIGTGPALEKISSAFGVVTNLNTVKRKVTSGRREPLENKDMRVHGACEKRYADMQNLLWTKGITELKSVFPKADKKHWIVKDGHIAWWSLKDHQSASILLDREVFVDGQVFSLWHNCIDQRRPNQDGKWMGMKDRLPLIFPSITKFKTYQSSWKALFICEGYKDCINAWLHGWNAVTMGGASVEWDAKIFEQYLRRIHDVYIVGDNDKAGDAFANRLAQLVLNIHNELGEDNSPIHKVSIIKWDELSSQQGYDLSDALKNHPDFKVKQLRHLIYKQWNLRSPELKFKNIRSMAFENNLRIWAGTTSTFWIENLRNKQLDSYQASEFWMQLDMRMEIKICTDQKVKLPIKRELFDPKNNNRFYYDNESGEFCHNRFKATQFWNLPKQATCPDVPLLIHCLIANILGNPPTDDWNEQQTLIYDAFLNWLAAFYQSKQTSQVAWMLTGIPGSGKNVFLERVITPIFGIDHVISVKDGHIEDKYTEWPKDKLIVAFDDISKECMAKNGVATQIKNLVTHPKVRIREMYKKENDQVTKTFNLLVHTNDALPFKLDPQDRRFTVCRATTTLKSLPEFMVDNIEKILDKIADEIPQFAMHLASREINWGQYHSAIWTEDKSDMIARGRTTTEKIWDALARKDLEYFLDNDMLSEDKYFAEFGNTCETDLLKECMENGFLPNSIIKIVFNRAWAEQRTTQQIKNILRGVGVDVEEGRRYVGQILHRGVLLKKII